MTGEYEYCSEIQSEYAKNMCYWQIAKEKQNPEICKGMSNAIEMQKCEYESGKR